MSERLRPRLLLHLIVAFTAWSVMFAGIYALQALGCAYGWNAFTIGPLTLHRILLVLSYLVALALVGAIVLWQWRIKSASGTRGFLGSAGLLASLAALGATALVFLPVVAVSACR
jgi:hypothetical protein